MGKMKQKQRSRRGFILIDVLVALLLMSFSLVVIFGNISLAARSAARARKRLDDLILERNERAETKRVRFTRE
jgi:type II secretory pathway pseudopilin PulG